MPLIIAPGDCARWLGRGARPARPDAAVPGRADAHVADLDACQQARLRREMNDRTPLWRFDLGRGQTHCGKHCEAARLAEQATDVVQKKVPTTTKHRDQGPDNKDIVE